MMIRSHSTSFNMCARLGRFPKPAKNYTPFKNQYALGSHYSVLVSSSSLSTCARRALRLTKVPMLRTTKLSQPVRGIKTHTGNQGKSRRQRMFALLAKGVKIVRIPFIVLSVFGLGYNHGMMEYARNPEKQELRFLEKIVKEYGCKDLSSVLVAREGEKSINAPFVNTFADSAPRSEQLKKVASVGGRIVKTAKAYVNEKLQEVIAKHDPDDPEDDLKSDVDFVKWTETWERIGGNRKWHFVLVESSLPNACVTELLPNTIFVTTSLLSTFTTNDDELGLVLGHEVSHLIHGHSSEKINIEVMLKTIEVLLLSLDPTEGILSVAIVGAISFFHSLLSLSYSRHHELEADELGIELAARACFDTRIAALTFKKMHDHSIEREHELSGDAASDKRLEKNFMSTHPPSLERFENMMEASATENPEKYADTHECAKLRKNFLQLWMR